MKRKASDLGNEEQPQAQKNQPKKKSAGTNEALFIDKDELMRSLHFAAIKTADDVCDEVKRDAGLERFDIDPQVVSAVTSLLWSTMSDAWSPDLNTFAGHAHRTSINVDDVRLLMRRNEELGKKIEEECGISPTSSGAATSTTRKNSGRRSRGAQNAAVPTAPSASTVEQYGDASGFPVVLNNPGLTPRPPVAQSTPLRATPAMGRKLPPGRLPSPIQEVNEAYMDVSALPLSPSFAHALMNNTEASTSFSRPRRERWAMEEGENGEEAERIREEQAREWEREQALKSLAESKGGGVASETEDHLWDDQPPPEDVGEIEEVPETPPLERVEEGAEHDSFDDDAEFVTMAPKRKVAKNVTRKNASRAVCFCVSFTHALTHPNLLYCRLNAEIGEKTLLRDLGISDDTRSCAREHERILSSTGNRSKVKPKAGVRRRNDSFFDEEEECEVVTIVDERAPAASSLGSTLPPPTQERDKGASKEDSFDEELELVDVVKPGNANEPHTKKPSCIVNPFRKSTSAGAPSTPSTSVPRESGRSVQGQGMQNGHNIHRVGISEMSIDRAPAVPKPSASTSSANHLQQNTAQRNGQTTIGNVSQSNFPDSLEDDFVTPRRPPSANARPQSAASVSRKTTPASNERADRPVQGRPGRLSNDSFFDDDLSRMFDLRSQSSQESLGVTETPQRRLINGLARKSTSSTRTDSEPSRAGHIGHRPAAAPTVSTRPLQINPSSVSGAQLPVQTSAPRPTNVDKKNPPPRSKFGGKFSAFSFENDDSCPSVKENKSSSAFSFSDATEANKTGNTRVSIRQESREAANDSFEDDDF